MENEKIFLPGNLRSPAEFIPVPAYFENMKWRLASNGVWLGMQLVGILFVCFFLPVVFGTPMMPAEMVLRQSIMVMLPALAMLLVFVNGSLDLSMGAVAGLVCAVASQALVGGADPFLAALAGLFIAFLIGCLNGALAGFARVPGFVVTFIVSFGARALVLAVTEGKMIMGFEEPVFFLGLAVVFLVLFLGAAFVWVQVPGLNARLADKGGKMSGRLRIGLPYVLSAVTAGVTGLFLTWYMRGANIMAGQNLEYDCILAVVLAGTCLYGRYGNVPGVILAAFFVTALKVFFAIANLPIHVNFVMTAVLIAAGFGFNYLYHGIVGIIYRSSARKKETPAGGTAV